MSQQDMLLVKSIQFLIQTLQNEKLKGNKSLKWVICKNEIIHLNSIVDICGIIIITQHCFS